MNDSAQDTVERESAESGQRASFSAIFWVLGLLLVAYPLSIGPAAWLHSGYRPARPAIEAIYAPVVFVSERSETLRIFLEWYVENVWMVK